ncbi:HNH endonuclease [Pleurocapsa sp. FMAR1]|uniref:HNH endonuclease n=1 Tax=Pleurocapsa sp. FMAR1 TaxID=3040204 RepID=UPI0029C91D06|nr:HNH endonuclease signature motif containing protein [Pleurocapsa sp. FMAR1]
MDLENKELSELFKLADKIGSRRYNRLTTQDFQEYLKFNYWRYINGDFECGTTAESKAWVTEHSDWYCPICSEKYGDRGGKTIDHKLPRSQYPWLSLEWSNLWVICRTCNREKGEKHWYEYEQYMYQKYPQDYPVIKATRPIKLLNSLK